MKTGNEILDKAIKSSKIDGGPLKKQKAKGPSWSRENSTLKQ